MKIIKLFLIFFSMSVQAEVLELTWLDLVPEHEKEQVMLSVMQQANMNNHDETSTDVAEQPLIGTVRSELNNTVVKIPGFVIPIEGTSMAVKEFLLVPFYGACIHVPPPPQNQLIHVVMEDFAEIKGMWEVVYVTGTLTTQAFEHDLANVGYRIDGNKIIAR
ncbi:DUF3299 domain-containing protein [Vibrio superstes]|uniref:Lipoprotein n=1 Tax=Vibrio superstes NBRC 103154 TaxID=1219062 RepID=A0A511QNN7_9VIBR|nr:DUF3299 domain-containing protein [Vibrio superstes]GEM78920.1 hypothetical protein VSU01S_11650 [Vibrio superstes NBRC 103154]